MKQDKYAKNLASIKDSHEWTQIHTNGHKFLGRGKEWPQKAQETQKIKTQVWKRTPGGGTVPTSENWQGIFRPRMDSDEHGLHEFKIENDILNIWARRGADERALRLRLRGGKLKTQAIEPLTLHSSLLQVFRGEGGFSAAWLVLRFVGRGFA
jgi:hypothetical protein